MCVCVCVCVCALGLFIIGIGLTAGRFLGTVYGDGKFYAWLIALLIFAALLAMQIWQIRHEIEEWNKNLYPV